MALAHNSLSAKVCLKQAKMNQKTHQNKTDYSQIDYPGNIHCYFHSSRILHNTLIGIHMLLVQDYKTQ